MTQEKIKLEKSTYETVKSMLESPDQENMVLGFECIKNADFKTNMLYILLLFKETNLEYEKWSSNVPEVYQTLDKLTPTRITSYITFAGIMKIMKTYEVSEEDYQFFMNRYSLYMSKQDDRIESVEIKIKLKPDESN